MENKTENHFEEFEKYDVVTEQDIFSKIWTQPRRIFKFINDNRYEKHLYVLMFLAGIVRAFDRAATKNTGDHSSLTFIIISCVIGGGLLGWISYYIYAALVSWTGRWMNGVGNTSSIFRMMAYAMIPSILSLVLLIPQFLILGNGLFSDFEYVSDNMFLNVSIIFLGILEIGLSVLSFVFTIIGLAEVQKFSIGKAILNFLMPIMIILVPILLLAWVFGAF